MKRGGELRLLLHHLFQSHSLGQSLPACGTLAIRGLWVCSQCSHLNLAVDRARRGQHLQLVLRSKQSPSSSPFPVGARGSMETQGHLSLLIVL